MPLSAVALEAATIGVEAYRRLRRGLSSAAVHSSYDGAINIATGAGIISLVPISVGRGPINVTVEGDMRLLSGSVATNDPVTIDHEAIYIGNGIPLSLAGSKVYDPSHKFPRPTLDLEPIRRNLGLARETAFVRGKFTGMGSLLHSFRGESFIASGAGLNRYSISALRPLRALISGIRERNPKVVRNAAKSIAGLGPGLTPSGDDLLSGLVVVLALSAENGLPTGFSYSRAARLIAKSTEGLSSNLGQEYIEQASLGRANEKVTRLVSDLLTGTSPEIEASSSDLIAMGHSSGTDILVGVIAGVSLVLQSMPRATGGGAGG